jgi:hypothetical protein
MNSVHPETMKRSLSGPFSRQDAKAQGGGMGIPACRSTPRDAGRASCPCPPNHGSRRWRDATSVPRLPSFACFAALREIFLRSPTLRNVCFQGGGGRRPLFEARSRLAVSSALGARFHKFPHVFSDEFACRKTRLPVSASSVATLRGLNSNSLRPFPTG